MGVALLLVDIQNDYFPKGKMELSNTMEAAMNASKLLNWFRKRNQTLVHIQHIAPKEGATFFLPDTLGAQIHQTVSPQEGETVLTKHAPNSFLNTDLYEILTSKDVKKLVICGMMTHMCIDSTVRAAKDLGFECTLIEDACATRSLKYFDQLVPSKQVHFAFISALNGTFAKVMTTKEFLMNN
ncbi:MAG: cysteine hydrolase family protein [Bacillota bacterium]|nr:cysteine hydrolase family protein [Bacillota bacterium]